MDKSTVTLPETVVLAGPAGSSDVCAEEQTLNLHLGPVHQTWNAASPRSYPTHPYSRGRICAALEMQQASGNKHMCLSKYVLNKRPHGKGSTKVWITQKIGKERGNTY